MDDEKKLIDRPRRSPVRFVLAIIVGVLIDLSSIFNFLASGVGLRVWAVIIGVAGLALIVAGIVGLRRHPR